MPSTVPATSLNGVITGNGATVDFSTAKLNVTMVVVTSGTITGGLVAMQASQDGVNWVSHTVIEPMEGMNHGCDNRYGAYRFWRAVVMAPITGGGSVVATFMEAG